MFGFFRKKKKEEVKSQIKKNVVPIKLITDQRQNANLYWDDETERFYDFIIPYKKHILNELIISKYFNGHVLVAGNGFIYDDGDYDNFVIKDDIRNLKVLPQEVILKQFIQSICGGNGLVLPTGYIRINSCMMYKGSFSYSRDRWLKDSFVFWNINNGYCTLSFIFNLLTETVKDYYISKCTNLEYEEFEKDIEENKSEKSNGKVEK